MPRAFASGRVKVVFSITGLPNAVRACAVCGIVFPTRRYYAAHVSTPQHLQAVAQLPRATAAKPRRKPAGNAEARNRHPYTPTSKSNSPGTFCKACRVQCRTPQAYAEHLVGRRHAQRLAGRGEDATPNAGGQARRGPVVRRRARRGPRGRWQVLSSEAVLWLQTRKAEQAVQQQRRRVKRVARTDDAGDRTERTETRRKRRLRRANDRVGQARGWKEARNRKLALAHARPEGKPGAAPARLKKRDNREVHICAVCGVTYVKRGPYEAHMASARHALAAQCVERPPSLPSWCAVCRVHLSLPNWRAYDEHIEGKAHKRNAAHLEGPPLGQPPHDQPPPPPPPTASVPMARFRWEAAGQQDT